MSEKRLFSPLEFPFNSFRGYWLQSIEIATTGTDGFLLLDWNSLGSEKLVYMEFWFILILPRPIPLLAKPHMLRLGSHFQLSWNWKSRRSITRIWKCSEFRNFWATANSGRAEAIFCCIIMFWSRANLWMISKNNQKTHKYTSHTCWIAHTTNENIHVLYGWLYRSV